jgi:MFS family permease
VRSLDERQPPQLGLRANLAQFSLLVGVNALVGGMVGQERTVLPLLGTRVFHLHAFTAALTFIVAFGVTKAATNFFAGTLSDRLGRKPLLVAGWVIGVPVPLLLMFGPSWAWIVVANVLLGLNQGLTWSTTVIMKIDLAGPKSRGLAMGLNEAAGYGAVAITALATGFIAARAGLRPDPFFLGLAFAGLGLGLSTLFVRETQGHAETEAAAHVDSSAELGSRITIRQLFVLTSRKWLIASGMGVWPWALGAVLLGVGTAMVYPTLLAAISDVAHPSWRATSVGVYRLWRDGGFAIGALLAGVVADLLGLAASIWVVAGITALSGLVVALRMYETLASRRAST